jgi:hypothetical protein
VTEPDVTELPPCGLDTAQAAAIEVLCVIRQERERRAAQRAADDRARREADRREHDARVLARLEAERHLPMKASSRTPGPRFGRR